MSAIRRLRPPPGTAAAWDLRRPAAELALPAGVGLLLRQALAAREESEAARRRAEAALAETEARHAAVEADRRRLVFLAQATEAMAASLDYETTLQAVAASPVPHLADWAFLTVVEPGVGLQGLGAAHRDPERQALVSQFACHHIPGRESTVTRAVRTGEPAIIADAREAEVSALVSDPAQRALLGDLGVEHIGSWPVTAPNGTVLGALSLVLAGGGRRFSAESREVARDLADRAGVHIANARLHRERTQIARTLQMSLRPRALPEVPGVDLGAGLTAAGPDPFVGGDFFDVFQGPDGGWIALLGDVVGKGVGAAVITAAARHTLRTGALVDPAPTRNLALLNEVLLSEPTDPIAFCTIAYARLHPRSDGIGVRICHAGHPAVLTVSPGGAVAAVQGGRGPAVGIYADAHFTETEIHLEPGALLVLYTDGVTEARADDLAAGRNALLQALSTAPGRSAGEVAEAVEMAALALTGGRPRDDIAVLVVRAPQP